MKKVAIVVLAAMLLAGLVAEINAQQDQTNDPLLVLEGENSDDRHTEAVFSVAYAPLTKSGRNIL